MRKRLTGTAGLVRAWMSLAHPWHHDLAGVASLPPPGDIKLEEHKLTEKQRKWLEASQRIGPGAMTKTERQLLERLYADMLPREQQELAAYIEAKFAKKETDSKDSEEKDPIEKNAAQGMASPFRGTEIRAGKVHKRRGLGRISPEELGRRSRFQGEFHAGYCFHS